MSPAAPARRATGAGRRPVHADAGAGSARASIISLSAPVIDPLRLLASFPHEDAVVWMPPDGPVEVGLGTALRLQAAGEERFAALRDAARRAVGDSGLRLYGGLAFTARGAEEPAWRAFGDAALVLPRLVYTVEPGRAQLTLAVTGAEDREAWMPRVAVVQRAIAMGGAPPRRCAARPELDVRSGASGYRAAVRAAVERIDRGELDKVVVARRVEAVLDGPADPAGVLAALGRREGCVRFAFRFGGTTFLGATPERLVSRSGLRVETEALAGSAAPEDAGWLARSDKDRREHALVADAVLGALRPLCARLTADATPAVRRLRDVAHLSTRVCGDLREPVHVLDLAAALHPTPAVGGAPRAVALAAIAGLEPDPRGWYAGPVGWIDGRGDGELRVALRSGLLIGDRCLLYAGAGIVAGSDPEAEHRETGLKLRAVASAVGCLP